MAGMLLSLQAHGEGRIGFTLQSQSYSCNPLTATAELAIAVA